MLPEKYKWLASEPGPKMILEGLKIYGTVETSGKADNPVILGWAKECGINHYFHDDIAWCGLTIAVIACRAGKPVPAKPLWAANWGSWGNKAIVAMLGDVLCFKRPGGNHVALYIGEDNLTYHILGGNQGDRVSITRILKERCWAIRRPDYGIQPLNVRKIILTADGTISKNEA